MADEEAPDKEIYLSRVIRLQALFRGALVRKQIEDVKQSFEALFAELEGNDTLEVDWESLLGFPKVVKKGHKKVKSSAVQCQTTLPSKENKALLPKEENEIKLNDDDHHSAKFSSVEVQTSFIDVTTAKHNEKESPVRNDDCDNILDDLDTSWKDRVVPFIQNNDFQSEPHQDIVEDFHLDLESDREKSDSCHSDLVSAKPENSAKRPSKYSPREVGSNSQHTSPRSITSVKSINDNRKESFEHSEDDYIKTPTSDRPTKSEQKIENNDSSRTKRQVNDGNSEKSESNRPKSGQKYNRERDDYDTEDRLNKHTSNKNDHQNDRYVKPENSGQQNSAPISSRSQNLARSNPNSDPDLPRVNSSRSRTSNKSDRSENNNRNNDDRYSDRVRNNDDEHRNVSSRQEHSDGGGTNRSDRSTERAKLSDRSDRSGSPSQHSHRSREPPLHSDRSTEREQPSNRTGKSGERSHRSNRSAENTPRSEKSTEQKLNSARSDHSVDGGRQSDRSDRSNEPGPSSNRSGGRSRASSTGSRKSEPTSKNNVDVLRPQRSSVSPVAFRSKSPDNQQYIQDSTTLTNVTSVWDSVNSMRGSQLAQVSSPLPEDANSLRELRKNLSMELLWVQQAIDSRKNYLKLKGKM